MRRLSLLTLFLLLLPGCRSARHERVVPAPSVAPPERFAHAPGGTSGGDPGDTHGSGGRIPASAPEDRLSWWQDFQDPDLAALIEQALADSPDLAAAAARLRAQVPAIRVARAAEKPRVDLSASGGRTQFFFPGRGPVDQDRATLSLPASWELDLWDRLSEATRGARLETAAIAEDLAAVRLSLSAEVATAFLGLREQRVLQTLLQAQLATNERILDSIRTRVSQGQSTTLDFYQQQQQAEGTRARLAQVDGERIRFENRLALLLGRAPGTVTLPETSALPDPPPLPPLGVPSDLLLGRPDLRASARRVELADSRVAQALRDRLPVVRLTSSLSYQAAQPTGLFRNLLFGLAGELVQPLLDGGRRRKSIEIARARVEESLAVFTQAFLRALEEVETALGTETAQTRFLEELARQETSARSGFEVASARYLEGAEDFLRVQTNLGSLHQVQQSIVSAKAQRLRIRIQLCRALGGAWTSPTKGTP